LGRVAEASQDWARAVECYQGSLTIRREFGDHYNQANTYHQLGRVAEELRHREQAKAYYLKSLGIRATLYYRLYPDAGALTGLRAPGSRSPFWLLLISDQPVDVEADDDGGLNVTLHSIARLWRADDDNALLASAALRLRTSPGGIKSLFQSAPSMLREIARLWELSDDKVPAHIASRSNTTLDHVKRLLLAADEG
jgi:tetratricopeptide (TPR) repeat protein